RSLTQRLGRLPDETILLPGHNYGGPPSTIGDEKRENPFLQMGLREFPRAMGGGRIALPSPFRVRARRPDRRALEGTPGLGRRRTGATRMRAWRALVATLRRSPSLQRLSAIRPVVLLALSPGSLLRVTTSAPVRQGFPGLVAGAR